MNYSLDATKAPEVPEVGALREWRRQLAAGERTRLTFDPLFYAACAEMNARDYLRVGVLGAANDYRRQAARLIVEASAEDVAA